MKAEERRSKGRWPTHLILICPCKKSVQTYFTLHLGLPEISQALATQLFPREDSNEPSKAFLELSRHLLDLIQI